MLELTVNVAGQVLEAGPFSKRWTLRWLAVLCAAGAGLLGGVTGAGLGGLAATLACASFLPALRR